MRIAEVSKLYDIPADTLRYYERIGLLPSPPRDRNGVREYGEEDFQRVQFVKCMRGAGMPIAALTLYMRLLDEGDDTADERLALLVEQRELMTRRIEEMQAGLDRLDYKIANYQRIAPTDCGACDARA